MFCNTLPKNDFTLVGGTTEVSFDDDPDTVWIADEEIDYLISSVNFYFKKTVKREDINWLLSGARALFDDKSKKSQLITHEYYLEVKDDGSKAPLFIHIRWKDNDLSLAC